MGDTRREVVATAAMLLGGLAMLIAIVVGFSWMDGKGRPLVHTREIDCTLTQKATSYYGETWLTTAECGGFDLALRERTGVDLVEGGVYRFTVGETDPIVGDARTVVAKVDEPVPPRALGEPGVRTEFPVALSAWIIPVALAAAGVGAALWIAGFVLMR